MGRMVNILSKMVFFIENSDDFYVGFLPNLFCMNNRNNHIDVNTRTVSATEFSIHLTSFHRNFFGISDSFDSLNIF